MVQFRDVLSDLLARLRRTRAAAFLPCGNPPPAPAPACPQPPRWPPRPPIRLPPLPLPPAAPLPLAGAFTAPLTGPLAAPAAPAGLANPIYPRESSTWGADGGWVPTTSGYETRVYEPPKQTPKVAPQQLAFSVFDGLFDD